MNKKIGFIVLTCVLVLTSACSTSPKRRSLGETLDDAVISNKLKAKYLSDKVINGFDINIDTWKGVVSLRGKADSQQQINRAIEVAELQQGVREVRSYLVLRQQEEEGLVRPKESFFQRKSQKKGEIKEESIGERRELKPTPVKKQPAAKPKKAPAPIAKPATKEKETQAAKQEPVKKPAIGERDLIFKDSIKEEDRADAPVPKKEPARKNVSQRPVADDPILDEETPRITDD